MTASLAFRISAILGLLAVGLGAFGAHGLQEILARHERFETWETASFYHLTHALVLCGIAVRRPFSNGIWWCFFAGVFIFSGSLYVLCLTNLSVLGAITPIGGVALLAGWAWLAIVGAKT